MTLPNRITNFVYGSCLLLLLLTWWILDVSLWWILMPTLLWLGAKVLGAIFIQWNFYLSSFCKQKTNKREIAITFDDGPDENHLPDLLHLLNEFQVKATFFVIGEKVKQNPQLLKLIHEQGHLIGNHSYTHDRYFDFFNYSRMLNEFVLTREIIYKITGIKTKVVRPPYGVTNPTVAKSVKQLALYSIGWSVRSLDTRGLSAQTLERLKNKTHPGAVVLLHDTTKDIVQITRSYLSWLKENRYRIVPMSQLLAIEVYE